MKTDKRRYFRIQDTVGLSYRRLDRPEAEEALIRSGDIFDLLAAQGDVIKTLLKEAAKTSPKVTALATALEQKRQQMVDQLAQDSELMMRLSRSKHTVSISACGLGFMAEAAIDAGSRLQLSLELLPGSQTIKAKGTVVSCDSADSGFYWRVEFYDMHAVAQEVLIQHIVQRQYAQLKAARDARRVSP